MLKNPAYIGKVQYNREQWSRKENRYLVKVRPESEWIVVDGIHPGNDGYSKWAESIEAPVLAILRKYGIK